MVKRKHDATTKTLARNCTRISDCVNAKYFADFLKDADLLNLSICNPIYYSIFYRYFANRTWWPLQNVQNVTDSTLNQIRKFNCLNYQWLEYSKVKLPPIITSLLLFNPHHDNEKYFWLIEKYKHNLQFLEVIGDCKNLHIPNGVKVFVQKLGNVNTTYDLNLPNSLHEVSISCFDNQNITSFPSSLTKLTFEISEVFGIQKYLLPNFPPGLVHLTLMAGFNQFVSKFPPGLMSLTIQNNIWNQRLVSLPIGLQYLKLYGKSTIPLEPGVLPVSLKIFIYKSKCNIQENVLPLQLKYVSITIGSQDGSRFDCNFLPQNLVQLNITSCRSYGLLHIKMIPKSVKIFKYKTTRAQVFLSELPQNLEELYLHITFATIFAQDSIDSFGKFFDPIIPTHFPPNLQILFVQARDFYHCLRPDVFPTSLVHLHYNCNDRITRNILPNSLKSLSLGKKCKQLLVYGSLPKSLGSFSAPHISRKTMKSYQKTGVIPKSCLIK
jgi:hypothetical protein